MKKCTLMLLICSTVSLPVFADANRSTLKDRVIEAKDSLVKKVSASLLLFKGDSSIEAQMKRLEFCNSLEENRVWQCWMHHPKRKYAFIARKLIIKNIDTLVRDEEYVQDFLTCKALILGRALTDQEIIDACVEAISLLDAYKSSRGIR